MSFFYVIAILFAIVLAPAIVFRTWNGGARWMRRRAARMTILPALLLLPACNAGGLLVAEGEGTADASAEEAGTDASPMQCDVQDPTCPTYPHAVVCRFYTGGPCQFSACEPGYENCNNQSADGCETDVDTDPGSCGGCGILCEAGASCVSGVCK